ncbi:MAG: T9SS type A sorting domain-containing protein [Bacteroidaceae bacterium]|nr:T9SS type A sorting domain-containing protein [Bacteroidaceae bacterium]
MKNFTLTNLRRQAAMLLALLCLPVMAQEELSYIDLTFAGRGESTTVESVTVTNLSRSDVAPVTLSGTDILRLADAETITPVERIAESIGIVQPILTPNPAMGDGTLIFDAKQEGPVRVGIYSTNGMLMESAVLDVQKGRNTARIPGQAPGIYIIKVEGQGLSASTRWICGGSKSFSGIALGGANQWNKPLPIKLQLPSKVENSLPLREGWEGSSNVVCMDFNEGDILRFEGKSGQMRTIVVNAPERSHSISFYFYPCKDVSGNTYPIVEAGGLLWMAEDLHAMQGLDGVSVFYDDEAADWKSAVQNRESTSMAMVMGDGDDDIYYTYSAARKALPEGWSLPTLSELDEVVRNLGGYAVVGDKMKRAGDRQSFREKRTALPDSLQLRISPKGFVGEDGNLTDTNTGIILTETREKSKALFMKIVNGSLAGTITADGLPNYAAVHIRGVRPAPSAYTEMISKLCESAPQSTRRKANTDEEAQTNPFTGEVNPYTGTPYGAYYTVDNSMKWMFADIKGQRYAYDQNYANENHGIYRYDDTQFAQMAPADSWEKDDAGKFLNITRLKKMCAQKLADGTYHTLKVTFDQSVRDPEVDNAWKDKGAQWLARDIENRPGSLILQEYGNQEQGFALQRTITLPGTYSMVEVYGSEKQYSGDAAVYEDYSLNEFYMKRLNLLAADFNQDGTDDVVVGFCGKWMVLDGTDYTTVLAQRTFPTDCVRACVGDLDENGYADLGFIYQHNNQISVRVLMDDVSKMDDIQNPDINAAATYAATLPVAKDGISSFLDIKFGDIANTGNSVLCLAVPFAESLKSTFYVLDRGAGSMLNQTYKLDEQSAHVKRVSQGSSRVDTYNYPNSTLAVVHTRGLGERPDVLLHNGLYRLGDDNQFVPVRIEGVKDNQVIDAVIPSDCVGVGRFSADLPDGYEQLAYLGNYRSGIGTTSNPFLVVWAPFMQSSVCANMLTPEPSNGTMKRTAGAAKSSDDVGARYRTSIPEILRCPAYFPAFCATSYSDLNVRRYKFESCQATMSEPRIKFALAAAPYWAKVPQGYAKAGEDYDYGDVGPTTEWAKWTSTTSGSENSNSTSASVIFGYEYEAKVSVFGMEIGKYGFDFETNLNWDWENSVAKTDTWTYESGCTAGRDNKVGLTMTPVWLYTYRCVDSTDPDEVGTTLVCGVPTYPRDLELSEADYMLLRGDRKDIPDLTDVFKNEPGNPLSYMSNPSQVKSTGGILWSNNDQNVYSTTGSDGSKFLSIEVSDETANTTKNTFGFDMKLVGFAGAFGHTVKAGFGAGYSHSWSTIYNTGSGTRVTGSVPLPKKLGDVPMFDWNMCRYTVKVGGQEFPVVNYIVKNVRSGR